MYNIKVFETEADWLEWRAEGIGASDVPSIMGEGFDTPFALWQEKLGLSKKKKATASMLLGKKHEAEAMKLLSEELGIEFREQLAIESKEEPYLRCTLDGHNEACIAEMKCVKGASKKSLHVIPKKYFGQVQMQLYLSGAPYCVYSEYDIETKTLWWVKVFPNKKYTEKMLRACRNFWKNVQEKTAPEMTIKESILYSLPDPIEVAWGELEDKYLEAKKMLSWAKANVEMVEADLIRIANEQPATGEKLELRVTAVEGILDIDSIRELRGVNLSEYRKAPTRRLSIVEKK